MRMKSIRGMGLWPLVFVLAGGIALVHASQSRGAEVPTATIGPKEVLAGLRAFFQKTALMDGSYRPGVDPNYEGLSDSAYSDLAPVTYAVVLHKTFGWKLPHEEKTRDFFYWFLRCR